MFRNPPKVTGLEVGEGECQFSHPKSPPNETSWAAEAGAALSSHCLVLIAELR